MLNNVFSDFDERLNNILQIKKTYYNEACILIYVYLDFLSKYTERPYEEGKNNRANFRYFLKNYSGMSDILEFIQIDAFISRCETSAVDKSKYWDYLDTCSDKLDIVKKGEELPITSFLSLDSIMDKDKKYFQELTLYNRMYDLRNFAVHEYRNNFYDGLYEETPILIYVNNIDDESNGWYSILFPFEFLFKILINCYEKVREEYEVFVRANFKDLLK